MVGIPGRGLADAGPLLLFHWNTFSGQSAARLKQRRGLAGDFTEKAKS